MDSGPARAQSQIVEFYAGKTLFLTGVTGFLGKILLAQIFQHCPDVKKVVCLIRGRQGVSASARFEKEVFATELFTNLIKKNPALKDKVQVRKFFSHSFAFLRSLLLSIAFSAPSFDSIC